VVYVGKMRGGPRLYSRTGGAGLRVDDNRIRLDHACRKERRETQNSRGGVATRVGHKGGFTNGLFMRFRKPVYGSIKTLRIGMVFIVPGFIYLWSGQSKVSRKINDFCVHTCPFFYKLHGYAMWQGEKNHIRLESFHLLSRGQL